MRLADALRALFAPGRHRVTPEDVEQLADRLGALEDVQAKREADWLEWQERMTRTLQRIAGRAGREKQLEAAEQDDGYATAKRTALALKFPNARGGA
jgi:antibiotic biosynthesis monooxygenase (ABM) superfamily enzyme